MAMERRAAGPAATDLAVTGNLLGPREVVWMPVSDPVCVWLKRDLRVTDHAALATAVERSRGAGVFAVFLDEPEVLGQPEWDSSHSAFQEECLATIPRPS
jgi:hypothetical protein